MQNRSEPPQAADHSTPELVKQLADDSATLVRHDSDAVLDELTEVARAHAGPRSRLSLVARALSTTWEPASTPEGPAATRCQS